MPSRLRVVFGYAMAAVVLVLARPTPGSLLAALPFAVLGEGLRLWASGHIEKTQRLATGGPYAHTRNPLYLGSALIAIAVAVACASVAVAVCEALYLAAFYPSVV
ncbi:MAG TPA: methyltransferase, partial [Vicinamibacteria bacterium]|nr:methyltransferase [Vicinamibacteria bacterium]